jgi:hypothetical protein
VAAAVVVAGAVVEPAVTKGEGAVGVDAVAGGVVGGLDGVAVTASLGNRNALGSALYAELPASSDAS